MVAGVGLKASSTVDFQAMAVLLTVAMALLEKRKQNIATTRRDINPPDTVL